MTPVPRREGFALGAAALVVVLVANLPSLLGWAWTPPGQRYTGLHWTNTQDLAPYLNMIERARTGHLLMGNPYLGKPHAPFQVRPVYTLGGWLAALTGVSNVAAYQILRALTAVALVLALHAFGRRLLDAPAARIAFVLVACFAAGLGAVFEKPEKVDHGSSIDLWMPEATTFASLAESPHFIVSIALIALVLAWVLDAAEGKKRALAVSGAVLLLALEHPYDLLTLLPVLVLWLAARRRAGLDTPRSALLAVGAACVVGVLGLGGQWLVAQLSPALATWNKQNTLPSPSPLMALSGLGLLLPLAAHGAWVARKDPRSWLVALAGFLPVVAMYAPVRFQRRLVEGASANLALLATLSLVHLWKTLPAPRRLLLVLPVLGLLPTTIALEVRDVGELSKPRAPFYVPRALDEGFEWLRAHTGEDDIIFCESNLGNFIPGYTGRQVWVGHPIQTPNFENRARIADDFFDAPDEQPLPRGVDWVVAGSFFEKPGHGVWLDGSKKVEKVFANDVLRVYRVVR